MSVARAQQPVDPDQRFVAGRPCPICGGHKDQEQHQGVRCYGYLSGDGRSAVCTRVESNHDVPAANGWLHRLDGQASDDGHFDWIDLDVARQEVQEQNELQAYAYRDASGHVLRRKFRFPDGHKNWDSNTGVKVCVPYRLPELIAAENAHVFIVDGEKDVEELRDYGVVATCAPNGLSTWDPAFSDYLADKSKVTIVRDKDSAGHDQVLKVKATVPQGVEVEIVEAASGKDAYDHLEAGHTVDEFVAVPPRFARVDLSTYEAQPIEWLHEPILLARAHTAINAPTGSGNTMLALILVKTVVRNGLTVVYLDQENGPDVIRPRMDLLEYSGEEMARVVYFPYPSAAEGEFAELVAEITRLTPALVVLDPMVNFYSAADYDEDSSTDTTKFHTKFVVPIKRADAAVLEFDHLGYNGKHARGSSAKPGHAEAEWTMAVKDSFDRDTTTTMTLKRGAKNRYARLPKELNYTIGGDGKDGLRFTQQHANREDEGVRKWKDLLATTEEILKEADEPMRFTAVTDSLRASGFAFNQTQFGKHLKDWASGPSSCIATKNKKYYYEEKTK